MESLFSKLINMCIHDENNSYISFKNPRTLNFSLIIASLKFLLT